MKFASAAMAFVTFSTFGMGCGPEVEPGAGASAAVEARRLETGRDLFKGMVFGVGPAAHHFDDLWKRPEVQARLEGGAEFESKRELAAERLMAQIEAQDPTFFERFGADLRSGDHLTIDRLLTETKEVTTAAAEGLRTAAGLQAGTAVQRVELEAGFWLYEETFVAVAVAAVLLIVVTQIDVTPVMENQEHSALRRDTWVDMLAKKSFYAM